MSCENCEESAYVIDKLAKLLAEIAVIVNGTEPHDTLWGYHDLPEKVHALKRQAAPPAAVADGCAEMRDALAFIERGILEGSIKCKPYIEFDPNATSLEPKSVLDLVRAAMLAAKKENGNG